MSNRKEQPKQGSKDKLPKKEKYLKPKKRLEDSTKKIEGEEEVAVQISLKKERKI